MPRNAKNRLQGCHVLSLRPVGGHGGLRRAVGAEGGMLIALSPWKLVAQEGGGVRSQLSKALDAERVLFTSPMAVRAAAALLRLQPRPAQQWYAVGAGTARALHGLGAGDVQHPERMDSEGLLALPGLRDVHGKPIGLVTAPGGRGRIETVLRRRGARLQRADVYQRVPVPPSPRSIARLLSLRKPPWLALSSLGALEHTLSSLPGAACNRLLASRVAAASERLAKAARDAGFERVVLANGPRPAELVAAMVEHTWNRGTGSRKPA